MGIGDTGEQIIHVVIPGKFPYTLGLAEPLNLSINSLVSVGLTKVMQRKEVAIHGFKKRKDQREHRPECNLKPSLNFVLNMLDDMV